MLSMLPPLYNRTNTSAHPPPPPPMSQPPTTPPFLSPLNLSSLPNNYPRILYNRVRLLQSRWLNRPPPHNLNNTEKSSQSSGSKKRRRWSLAKSGTIERQRPPSEWRRLPCPTGRHLLRRISPPFF